MLKSLSFAAALVDASLRDASTGEAVDALLAHAPGLPIVVTSDADDERERQQAGGRAASVSVLKRRAPAELVLHVLCSAVERADRQRQIAALSQNDLTTGARNRPTFCAQLARCVEQREPFVLCCFGIDGLAEINESLGHIRGDAVLAASVARLSRELGPTTTIGRLGGGVFAVLANAPTSDTGPAILRTIRQVFELPFDLSDTHVRVEVNVASVSFPDHGLRAEELLRKVERALREAKAIGERRRSSYPPPIRHPA
jgi:diguanylate cyclase (GGDEF)-like protein